MFIWRHTNAIGMIWVYEMMIHYASDVKPRRESDCASTYCQPIWWSIRDTRFAISISMSVSECVCVRAINVHIITQRNDQWQDCCKNCWDPASLSDDKIIYSRTRTYNFSSIYILLFTFYIFLSSTSFLFSYVAKLLTRLFGLILTFNVTCILGMCWYGCLSLSLWIFFV